MEPLAHHHEFSLRDLDGYVLAVHTPFAGEPETADGPRQASGPSSLRVTTRGSRSSQRQPSATPTDDTGPGFTTM